MRFQQGKKFLMDESHPFQDGLLRIACPLHRFLDVVDNVQERKDDFALAFLGTLAAFTLNPATIVREIRKRAEIPVPFIAKIVPQLVNVSREICGR